MDNPAFISIEKETNEETGYIPGVCNIGPEEIQRRRAALKSSIVAAILAAVIYILVDIPSSLAIIAGLVVFLLGASLGVSYMQVREKFCVAFGATGVFNFGTLGPRSSVEENDAKRADRSKVRKMLIQSVGIGVIYTTAVLGLNSIL